ncbi:MAG: class II fructose-bisphosphate aldolase, partial [Sedimenticola sp.]|nr:class II fructose-bisphosphate aldolase [Sedimenticola sp.]
MALVQMHDMLRHAYENKYAVGSFDVVSMDFLQGVINAAEQCRAPVILGLAEPYSDHFDMELLATAVESAARRSSVPVAIHY